MLLTLILLTGSLVSSAEHPAVPLIPAATSHGFEILELLATGAFVAVEPSSDLPVHQYFLAEDLDERDEEREAAFALSYCPGALSAPHLLPPSTAGSLDRGGHARSSRHISPLLQSVWLRC